VAKVPKIPAILRQPGKAERQIRARRKIHNSGDDSRSQIMAVWSIASEFVVAVISGGLIGWGVDALAHTKPWGILIGFGVGLCYGFMRFIKEALALTRSNQPPTRPRTNDPTDPDDAR